MESWTKDSSYGLKLYKWLSWPIGTWPFGCENYFSIFRFTVTYISQITFLISLAAEISQNCISANEKIDYTAILSCVVMCLVKMTTIRIHHNKLLLILSSAMQDWITDKDKKSQIIMRSYAQTGRLFYIGQMSSAFFTIGIIVVANIPLLLIDPSNFENVSLPLNPLPMPMDCHYKNMSKTSNIWVYAIQSLQLSFTTIGHSGTDIFFFGLAMHICGQLEILKNQISQFGSIEDKSLLRCNLRLLIKRHNHLINLSRSLEDSFTAILLVQLFFNSISIVFLGIQVIVNLKTGNITSVLRTGMAVMVIMFQFFIYCYSGDCLTTLNESLMDAVYNCTWYNFPKSINRSLIFIMMRTRVKFHITAGKFCNMDMENFKNIVKASLSYISVLTVMLKLDQ